MSSQYVYSQYKGALEFADRVMQGRDLFTYIHEDRTAELAVAIARRLGSAEDELLLQAKGARLHDIGKLLLPLELLTKPGKISEQEYRYLQHHVEYGERLIEPLDLPGEIHDMVCMHHERMDGRGYPRGLVNGQIPRHARIAAVSDMAEAMLADRPYRKSMGLPRVLEIIDSERGKALDDDVVGALHEVIDSGTVEWLQ